MFGRTGTTVSVNQECVQGLTEPVSNVLLGLVFGCPNIFYFSYMKHNVKLVIFRGGKVKIGSACVHWMMLSKPSVNM